MDLRTGIVVAVLMMLLNGGVLGLMHKSLSPDVQPSAADWRIGTLLFAGGCLLFALQDVMQQGLILPLANLYLLGGMSLYWRSVRRFSGRPDTPWIFAPALIALLGIWWFVQMDQNNAVRVYFATVALVTGFLSAAYTLHTYADAAPMRSRTVLAWIFVLVAAFFLLRGLGFLLNPNRSASMLEAASIFNLVAPVVVTALPVVGTTAFLVMCSERIGQQWKHAAATDYLTGLPNRRTITGSGEARFSTEQRGAHGLAIAVIDIDHFKQVNDKHGHDVGDAALKHVSGLLAQTCRGPHMVGRQGGEEFVAILVVSGAQEALAASERLRQSVEAAPFSWKDLRLPLTISVGVALMEPRDTCYDDLLRRADQAVYAAKTAGRNRVVLAT